MEIEAPKTASQDGRAVLSLQPFQVTRAILIQLFSSKRLVQRLIASGWILTTREGRPGCEALFDYESTKLAYERLKRGDTPQLLPSELRYRTKTVVAEAGNDSRKGGAAKAGIRTKLFS